MDFISFTNKKNILEEKKVSKYIIKKYKKVICIIDYGSQVINQNKDKSDFDYVVILEKMKREPFKKDYRCLGKKLTTNVISLNQLKNDCFGAYQYYFITKIINPCNFTYIKNKKVEININKFIGIFINNLRIIYNQKKYLNRKECAANFLINNINLYPHYLIVISKKLKNNKSKIWNLWSQYFFNCYQLVKNKNKNVKTKNFKLILEKEQKLVNWFVYAIILRKNRSNYINKFFKKNEIWFKKNQKFCNTIIKFLESEKNE